MKYAIISDVHGNLPALNAALSDADEQGADMHLLLGDYNTTFPWANEVAETISGLKAAVVIQGNNEGYMAELRGQNQSGWKHEQFMPMYWNYRSLTPKNLEYLTTLPKTAVISDSGEDIHLAHSMKVFYRTPKIKLFHSEPFCEAMKKRPFTHDEYLSLAREALLSRADAVADINALPKGVYLFGHNHLQFHMEYDGKLFVNPGSCGAACDCDPAASYTLLERDGNNWRVIERKVRYDIEATARELRKSGLAAEAPFWTRIIEKLLVTGKDYFGAFVMHVAATGQRLGRTEMPADNDVWELAIKTWDLEIERL